MTQETQAQSLFETNDSAQSALKSNNTSKSVLDLGASSTKSGKIFGKNDERILSHDLCQNSQSILGSSLKANNNFQNTTNSNQNLNNTTQNALNASDETNSNFENALNTDIKKPNNDIDTEKSELDLSEISQIPLKSNSHSSDKAKSALTSACFAIDNDKKDFDIDFSDELKNEIAKNPNFKPMISYNKKPFNSLIFTNFTALDFNLFMCFCFVAKNKRNSSIKLTFNDLEFLMGKLNKDGNIQKINKNPARLFAQFDDFCEKAAKVIVKQEKNNSNSYTHLFDSIEIYKKEKIIVIRFNALMVECLNNITRYFTEFELQQYCNLKSKYTKQLYVLLMDNLYIGKFKISKDELIRRFSLSDKKLLARQNNFEKIVFSEKIMKEIKTLFCEFSFHKEYGINNKVIAYNFIYKK